MTRRAERQGRERSGRRAETLCVLLLRLKGYRILARRFRNPVGEIDIVARRGKVLAMVEVKARQTRTLAVESVTPRQRQRIERAALAFLAERPDCAALEIRFDVMTVSPGKFPNHMIYAWRPGP